MSLMSMATHRARRNSRTQRPVEVVNGSDRAHTKHSYILWFGQCAPTYLLIYASGVEDALEIAADWLFHYEPGHLMTHYGDEHLELCKEVATELELPFPPSDAQYDEKPYDYEGVYQQAEADLTLTESGFLTSYEWGIALEDPTPREVSDFVYGRSRPIGTPAASS